MLFAQIPKSIGMRIVGRLRSLNILGSGVTFDKPSELTRFDKVNVVSNYINEHLEVGDVDNPKTYFKGQCSMHRLRLDDSEQKRIVYFAGKTEQTTFGLVGSAGHMIGVHPEVGYFKSPDYNIDDTLFKLERFSRDIDAGTKSLGVQLPVSDDPITIDHHLDVVNDIGKQIQGPPIPLEFLSKRLFEGPLGSKHILLGSPIYVAQTD